MSKKKQIFLASLITLLFFTGAFVVIALLLLCPIVNFIIGTLMFLFLVSLVWYGAYQDLGKRR